MAQITGTCAASQIQRISSCTSARRSKPHSTARSPRAIITPQHGARMAVSSMSGRFSKPRRVSIFSTMAGCRLAQARQVLLEQLHVPGAVGEGQLDDVGVLGHEGQVLEVLGGQGRQAEACSRAG